MSCVNFGSRRVINILLTGEIRPMIITSAIEIPARLYPINEENGSSKQYPDFRKNGMGTSFFSGFNSTNIHNMIDPFQELVQRLPCDLKSILVEASGLQSQETAKNPYRFGCLLKLQSVSSFLAYLIDKQVPWTIQKCEK